MIKKERLYNIFKYITLIGYVLCIVVLIVESCINGTSSTNQSNSIGNVLADIFNTINGDQAKEVPTTSITISNKITSAFVGDEYTLTVDTMPSDATDKAIKYASSNDVAKVSNDGTIKFLKEGYTTITATSEKYTHISDSFNVEVKAVSLESLSSSIANEIPDENNIYTLIIGNTYSIKTSITPSNTTNRQLSYSLDNNSFIELENNTIKVNSFSGDNLSTITVRQNDIFNTIKIKTEYKNNQPLSSLKIDSLDVYVGDVVTPKVIPNPLNATFTNYTLSASNDNVEIIDNSIKGLKEGKTTLRATSNDYSNISTDVEINVLKSPLLESFNFTFLDKLSVNNSFKLDILPTPYYASIPSLDLFNITSSNKDVATSDNGVITALKAGTTTISITYNNLSINKELSVYDPHVDAGKLEASLTQNNIYTNKEYDLSSLLEIYFNNVKTTDVYYSLKDDSIGSITNDKLTINKPGKTTITLSHLPSGQYREIDILCVSDFKIIDEENKEISSISLNYLEEKTFKIESENIEQRYKFEASNNVYIKENNNTYTVKSLVKDKNTNIKIYPLIDNEQPFELFKELTILSDNKSTTSLTYKLINASNGNTVVAKTEHSFRLPINGHYQIIPIIDENISNYNYSFTSLHTDIATINDAGLITFNKIGVVTFVVKENISNLTCQFDINVLNYIAFIKDNNYTLSGEKLTYNEETDTYILTNGYSARFKINFSSSSTYTDVTFKSSNEDVLKIASDGTITPIKAGETIVSAIIDDGMLYHSIDLKIEVIKKDIIEKMDEFLLLVRKALGHFGAFLFFGVLTTLTYLFFYKKSLKKDTIIALSNGIILASITELIQLLIPGRTGNISDVLINLLGFIVGFIFITIILKIKKQITFTKEK